MSDRGASLKETQLPEDIPLLMNAFSSRLISVTIGRRRLACIRRGEQ
jgi:hypothetical protein